MGVPIPKKGDVITVTHVVDGTSWGTAIRVDSVVIDRGTIVITAAMSAGPKELAGIDARLDNQRNTIDRLLHHLQEHCPKMTAGGHCPHME